MGRRLKVLISAYACEPGKGSEPEVGWQWVTRLCELHDVTVITRSNNAGPIEAALASATGPKPHFIFHDLPPWVTWLKHHGLGTWMYYVLWQASLRWRLRRKLREFDLIHHLTFNSFRLPGFWWFCPKPVVLGPLGGGQICPWRFLWLFGRRLPLELIRSLTVLAAPLYPHLLLSFGSARLILVANRDTAARIPGFWRSKVRYLLEAGIDPTAPGISNARRTNAGSRLLWISRIEKIKGLDLMLHAFAEARQRNPALTLTVVGGGSEAARMQRLATRLSLGNSVRWLGTVPKAAVQDLMAEHDIFVFTSLHDTSGNVLLEAMAAGLPSVTLKHHGAAEMTTDATSIRIEPTSVRATVAALAEAVVHLSQNAELRAAMGTAARQRVLEHYAWPKKVAVMDRFYQEAATSE